MNHLIKSIILVALCIFLVSINLYAEENVTSPPLLLIDTSVVSITPAVALTKSTSPVPPPTGSPTRWPR